MPSHTIETDASGGAARRGRMTFAGGKAEVAEPMEVVETDDAEEAAWAAERAAIAGQRPVITTEYADPWDHGQRPDEAVVAEPQQAQKQPSGKAKPAEGSS